MEKVLYLLLQIVFANFRLVTPDLWIKVLESMVEYMRLNYVMQDTITIGKATCICLGCFIQDPDGVENFLQTRMEGLWDCILDDQLKFSSATEKKIVCLLLCKLII